MKDTPTRVKVRVADLIKRVEEVKAEDEKRFQRLQAKYEKALEVWKREAAKALRAAAAKADSFDYGDYAYGRRYAESYLQIPVPEKPTAPTSPDPRHEKALRMLRMVSDEEMALTLGHDLAVYL